jgi:TetR/AcrR family transcriptional regulator
VSATRSAPEAGSANNTATALLDATERLLISGGAAAVSTRRVAEEAQQSHGLIRYHFGGLENLMVETLNRGARRILDRQRELYAGDAPFVTKWRTAMAYLESDLQTGTFPKLAAELMALGWNVPAYRDSLRRMMEEFTEMLGDAVRSALTEYDVPEIDIQAVATLIRTFQIGMMAERLAGVDTGHAVLLAAIDGWLQRLPRRGEPAPD